MPPETLIPIMISGVSAIIAVLSFRRNSKGDVGSNAAERATMVADLRYIREAVDDIKLQYRALSQSVHDQEARIIAVEQSCKSAHHRIDDLMRRTGHELE